MLKDLIFQQTVGSASASSLKWQSILKRAMEDVLPRNLVENSGYCSILAKDVTIVLKTFFVLAHRCTIKMAVTQ